MDTALKLIRESLTCAICKDQFKTPVVVTICSHNFCSICIRRYFTIKQECPICGVDASPINLFPNRIVGTLSKHIDNLSALLNKKKNELEQLSVVKSDKFKSQSTDSAEKVTFQNDSFSHENTPKFSLNLTEFFTQSQGFSTESQPFKPQNALPVESNDSFFDQSPSTNNEQSLTASSSVTDGSAESLNHVTKHHDDLSGLERTAEAVAANQNSVNRDQHHQSVYANADCPVCGCSVATASINLHLDGCLAREEKKKSLRQNTPKRLKRNKPFVTKLAYNLLTLRELRAKLKDIGLPTSGDKAELKSRHQEFVAKYQAEQDKIEPRSIEVLINELKREEMRKKHLEVKLSPIKSSFSCADEAHNEKQMHLKKYAKQYDQLEEAARNSIPSKRARTCLSLTEDAKIPSCNRNSTILPFFQQEKARRDKKFAETRSSATTSIDCIVIDEIPNKDKDSSFNQNSTILPFFQQEKARRDKQCGNVSPESQFATKSLVVDESRSVSPELYAITSDGHIESDEDMISNKSDLKSVIEEDSQSDEIKYYIDATLSETY